MFYSAVLLFSIWVSIEFFADFCSAQEEPSFALLRCLGFLLVCVGSLQFLDRLFPPSDIFEYRFWPAIFWFCPDRIWVFCGFFRNFRSSKGESWWLPEIGNRKYWIEFDKGGYVLFGDVADIDFEFEIEYFLAEFVGNFNRAVLVLNHEGMTKCITI